MKICPITAHIFLNGSINRISIALLSICLGFNKNPVVDDAVIFDKASGIYVFNIIDSITSQNGVNINTLAGIQALS